MWTVFCTLEEGYAPKISVKTTGFVQSWILEKSVENGNKIWKDSKKSGVFFLSSYLKCFIEEICY